MNPSCEKYRGRHRDITYEAVRSWHLDGRECWAFYLFLAVEQFPKEHHADLWRDLEYTNFGTPLQPYARCLEDLNWHCGMTFYEKRAHEPFRFFQAGCDFQHYWDEGHTYTAEGVTNEAIRCVDSLYEKFPNLISMETLWEEHRRPFKEGMAKKNGGVITAATLADVEDL